ncbi:thioredoxin fold domain-containing protein [bacterium]|nr:thioredoxin fold domain-containing protein [bacterium]
MGMNLKEKFQNINKKKVAIISGVLFAICVCSACAYEYFQMKGLKQAEMQQEKEIQSIMLQGQQAQAAQPMRPSDYKIGIEYNEAMKQDKPVFVLFYADWCRYCIGFMPTFQSLSKIYEDEYNFTKVNIEDEKYQKTVKEAGLTGFPTVYLMDPKYDNKVLLSNSLFSDMKSLRRELDRFLRIRNLIDKK